MVRLELAGTFAKYLTPIDGLELPLARKTFPFVDLFFEFHSVISVSQLRLKLDMKLYIAESVSCQEKNKKYFL